MIKSFRVGQCQFQSLLLRFRRRSLPLRGRGDISRYGDGVRYKSGAVGLVVAMLILGGLLHADPGERSSGDLPDPFLEIWDQAVIAMDQAYGDWKRNSEQAVDSTAFIVDYLASVYPDPYRRMDSTLLMQADENRDRRVSRAEAMRFLELQLGIRWETNDLLRFGDGRVVDFQAFLAIDRNRDSKLSADEVSQAKSTILSRLDQDRDGNISVAEFSNRKGPFLRDPVGDFRASDTNLDAKLDAAELWESTPVRRRHLIKPNLSAFDEDSDDCLSLTEYRVSMLGNFNYPWQSVPEDLNRDRRLSFKEFRFDDRSLFQLQRRFYFHRFDADRDGQLSPDEFPFETTALQSLVRISTDDQNRKEIFRDDDYPICGSPDISPDGRLVLFDAGPPQEANRSVIRLMTIDGEDARDLCDGSMPTWSADGSRFACSRLEGGSSVWIMKLDGSVDLRIDDGWGAQWSPDGKSVAYTNDNSLRVYDVNSGETRTVLAKGSHPYRFLFWNMAWSPDGERLVFKGKLNDNDNEIAIVNVSDSNLTRRFKTTDANNDDFAWTPDGKAILFPWSSETSGRSLIYRILLDSDEEPVIESAISDSLQWKSVAYSRDGKWLVLAGYGFGNTLPPGESGSQARRGERNKLSPAANASDPRKGG